MYISGSYETMILLFFPLSPNKLAYTPLYENKWEFIYLIFSILLATAKSLFQVFQKDTGGI